MNTIAFGDISFSHVCTIEADLDAEGQLITHMPQDRYAKAAITPLNRYGNGPFVKFSIPRHHRDSGVYVLTLDRQLRYVGEAADLSARYNAGYGNISPKNCYAGGQQTNCRLNNLIYQALSDGSVIDLWFHPTSDYKALELQLRRELAPEWNRI